MSNDDNDDSVVNNQQPNIKVTPDQKASKLKKLETENEMLRERLANLEKLMEIRAKANKEEQVIQNNRFSALLEEDDEMETGNNPFEIVKRAIKRKNTNAASTLEKIKNTTDKTNKISEGINAQKKTTKPPPLHIHKQAIKDTLQIVKGAEVENFEIKRINKDKHSLMLNNLEEYQKVQTIFKETDTSFFTYTPKELKPKTVVLKGLNEDEDVVEIKECIESHSNIKVVHITQLKTKRSIEKKIKLPLYLIQCSPDTNMREIYNIKSINYQWVTWENLKKRNEIMQCRKCQRLGHAAANCNLGYRCVKCDGDHQPGDCKIKEKTLNANIYCVNCNSKGHPASFKGCPVYQKALERLQQKIKDKQQQRVAPKQIHSMPVTTENGSFAEVLRQNTTGQMTVHKLAAKVEKMAQSIQQQSEQIAQLLSMLSQI